jgi:GGDEF domain-containing protein
MAEGRRWQDDPAKVRALVAGAGLAILLVLAGILWVRRVDPVEIWATLLFLPLFVAVVLWRIPGGIVGGIVAAGVYTALRMPAIEAAGFDAYLALVVGRGLAYLAFGGIGGWAMGRLQQSLTKLDLYDQIDDDTGLYNARFLVEGIELERARVQRYRTLFSIVAVRVPAAPLTGLGVRRRRRVLRMLGGQILTSIRTVDRGVHVIDGDMHRIVLLLPETPAEGAEVFAARFCAQLAEALTTHGAAVDADAIEAQTFTIPGDEDAVAALREEFTRLVPA